MVRILIQCPRGRALRKQATSLRMAFLLCGLGSLLGAFRNAKTMERVYYQQALQQRSAMDSPESFVYSKVSKTQKEKTSPITWPQVDDRIGRALLDGYRIIPNITYTDATAKKEYIFNDTTYEAPIANMATVVTCFYEVRGKHPCVQYADWFRNLLHSTDPMVVFVGHDKDLSHGLGFNCSIDWFDFVKARRQHAPTIIARLPFANLTSHTQFDEEFWQLQAPRRRDKRSTPSYRVYNEKILFMKEVAFQNPFESEHFVWVDAGYFRFRPGQILDGSIVRNNLTHNGIEPGKIVYLNIYKHPNNQEIGAGVWGGNKQAIMDTNEKYWMAFWDSVTKGLKVGLEQRVIITLCRSWPELCHMVYSGHDDDWFVLGKVWMRSATFDFRTVHYQVSLDDFNISLAPEKYRHQLLPVTIVKDPVVFPEGVATGESVAIYYKR